MAREPGPVRRSAGRAFPRARSDEMALTRESSSDPEKDGLALGLTPSGTLALRSVPDADPLDPAAASRIEAAFAVGAGHGLLHLGAAEVDTPLPPGIAFWRDLGRAFVTQLCAMPEVDASRKRLHVPLPEAEIAALAAGAPPMVGGEYLDTAALAALLGGDERGVPRRAGRVRRARWRRFCARGTRPGTSWDACTSTSRRTAPIPTAPFAFLATYSTRLTGRARRSIVRSARRSASTPARGTATTLLALLEPVQIAAARSALLRELVDSGDVYRPLGLTPDEAYRFLRDIPVFEASGVVVRVPDWWAAKRPPRPQVQVTLGARAPGGVGTDALLDFDVRVTLDGETLTAAEIARVARPRPASR